VTYFDQIIIFWYLLIAMIASLEQSAWRRKVHAGAAQRPSPAGSGLQPYRPVTGMRN
jgi:hypothetical protein